MIRKRFQFGGSKSAISAGFTIIELMIVIAIIAILASIAVGRYQHSVWRAREAVLRNDLFLHQVRPQGPDHQLGRDLGDRPGRFVDGHRPDRAGHRGRAQRRKHKLHRRHSLQQLVA